MTDTTYVVTCYKARRPPTLFFLSTEASMRIVKDEALKEGYYVDVFCPAEPASARPVVKEGTDRLSKVSAAMQRIIDSYKKGK